MRMPVHHPLMNSRSERSQLFVELVESDSASVLAERPVISLSTKAIDACLFPFSKK